MSLLATRRVSLHFPFSWFQYTGLKQQEIHMRQPRPQYSGYKQSAKWRIKKAKQMIKWEEEAKKQGIPVARLIAQQLESEDSQPD